VHTLPGVRFRKPADWEEIHIMDIHVLNLVAMEVRVYITL